MRFVIPSYGIAALCFCSLALIALEGVLHDSNNVWHGNVTVTRPQPENGHPSLWLGAIAVSKIPCLLVVLNVIVDDRVDCPIDFQ